MIQAVLFERYDHIFHTWVHKIVYKRLTDDEIQESYNYDLDADNSVPDNSKF